MNHIQSISPLWEVMPGRQAQAAEKKSSGGSVFADVFRSAVENVRQSESTVAETEYLLSTGQLDNPAQLSLALYKAEVSMSMLTQLRDRAMNAYSELSRINL